MLYHPYWIPQGLVMYRGKSGKFCLPSFYCWPPLVQQFPGDQAWKMHTYPPCLTFSGHHRLWGASNRADVPPFSMDGFHRARHVLGIQAGDTVHSLFTVSSLEPENS